MDHIRENLKLMEIEEAREYRVRKHLREQAMLNRITEIKLCKKVLREASNLLRSNIRLTPLPRSRINHRPMIHTRIAPIIFGP